MWPPAWAPCVAPIYHEPALFKALESAPALPDGNQKSLLSGAMLHANSNLPTCWTACRECRAPYCLGVPLDTSAPGRLRQWGSATGRPRKPPGMRRGRLRRGTLPRGKPPAGLQRSRPRRCVLGHELLTLITSDMLTVCRIWWSYLSSGHTYQATGSQMFLHSRGLLLPKCRASLHHERALGFLLIVHAT